MKKDINVVVAGGREFIDYKFLSKVLDDVVSKLKEKGYETISIVCGMSRGADILGKKYAEDHGLPVIKCPADWKRLGKRAGPVRNEEMAKIAQLVLVFWDGASRGSKNMIDMGHKYKRIVLVYRY